MAQVYSLSLEQKILWGLFLSYMAAFTVEKTNTAINGVASTASVTSASIRTTIMWAFAVAFLWYMYKIGPVSDIYEHAIPSSAIIAFLITIYGIQSFTSLNLKASADEKSNEYGKYESNIFLVYLLYVGALLLNWWFFDKKGVPLVMSGISALIVLIYLTYASVATRRSRTLSKMYLSEGAFNIPMLVLFFIVILYFAVYSSKNQFIQSDQRKVIELLKTFLLYIPPIFIAYQMGTCVSDTVEQQRMLVVSKLQNLSQVLSSSWDYSDISQKYISDIIDYCISTDGKPLKATDVHGRLIAKDRQEVAQYNLTDTVPLDLWSKINDYVKSQKNRGFDISNFMDQNRKNDDPLKGSPALAPINVGILMLFITSLIVIGWGGAFYWSKLWKGVSPFSWVLAAITIGIVAYMGYLMRNTSHNVDSRNEVYCMQYKMNPQACAAARPQFEQSTFFLADRVAAIKNGEGVITVNNTTLFDGAAVGSDPNGNRNMKTTYGLIAAYGSLPPSTASLKDIITSFATAYNVLVSCASVVNLKIASGSENVKIYTGSDEIVFGNVLYSSITLSDIMAACIDNDNFAQSLNLTAYVPKNDVGFNSDNDFFGLHADSQTQVVSLYFNYEVSGQTFKDSLKTVLFTKNLFRDITFTATSDYNKTMNPSLALKMYGGDFDVNNPKAKYINVIKKAMKDLLAKNFIGSITSYDATWRAISGEAAEWDVTKTSMTGTQYDLITSVITAKLSVDDQIIITDALMHAISPRAGVLYDAYIDDYMNKLFWIAKLESVHDNSQVTADVNRLESKNMTVASVLLGIGLIMLFVYVFNILQIDVETTDYFQDYFKTGIAGSKKGVQHNGMLMIIILSLVCFNLFNYINLYMIENRAISSVLFTSTPLWGGKIVTIPLVISICILLAVVPLFYRKIADRSSVYFVTLILIAMLCSPLVYFMKNSDAGTKTNAYKKLNGTSLLIVCCLTFFLLISGTPSGAAAKNFRIAMYILTFILALTFTSLPTMIIESLKPDMSEEELEGRMRQVNIGVFSSLGIYVIIYFIYFVIMKKEPLFTNTIPKMELPKSLSTR